MNNRYPCNLTLIRLIHIFTQEYWHLCLKSTKLCDFVQRGWKFPKNRFCHFETTPAEWLGSMKTISHSTHPPSLPQLVKVRSISSRPVWAAPGSPKTGSYCPHPVFLLSLDPLLSCQQLSFSIRPDQTLLAHTLMVLLPIVIVYPNSSGISIYQGLVVQKDIQYKQKVCRTWFRFWWLVSEDFYRLLSPSLR